MPAANQVRLVSLQLEQAHDCLSEEELWYVLWEVAQGLAFLHLNRVLHLVSQCAISSHGPHSGLPSSRMLNLVSQAALQNVAMG